MLKSLHLKFLLLLFGVAAVALSGTLILRELMLGDFRDYLEGDMEDRAYWILANFEGAYERDSGWRAEALSRDALWALTLGFEIRLLDGDGQPVAETAKALDGASPSVKRRLSALSRSRTANNADDFATYPLFLAGRQIGTLEMKSLRPAKEALFVGRADRFLLLSMVLVGGLAALVSVLFSSRLTGPIRELSHAVVAVSRGDLKRRVSISREDEVGGLAKAFNAMASALETQESLRKKLIADVAHELRTPLGVIRGEIEAMMDGLIPNDEERLQSLYEETGRLKHMVEGIEELNQAEASVLSLRRQRLLLRPFLERIVERFRAPFKEKGVTLELRCADEPELDADPERMSQILVNLLSNALKATGREGRVSIAVAPSEEGLAITVGDTGKGIREEDLPFVFERFYRGLDGGLGIGLTIVKELVQAHGGRIEAKSSPDKGSSFTLLFPAKVLHNSS
jgi:two-component system sensor histidine kinase BaeS